MKFFVTGSSGFIGKSFIKEASKKIILFFHYRKNKKKLIQKLESLRKIRRRLVKIFKKNRCSSSSCSSWS